MTERLACFSLLMLIIPFSNSIHLSSKKRKEKVASFRPVVLTSGLFLESGLKAWELTQSGGRKALDALVEALDLRLLRKDGDGAADLNVDAMVYDGDELDAGAISGIRGFSAAVGVARAVMTYTAHTLLAGGEPVARFAMAMGFDDNLAKASGVNSSYSQRVRLDLSIIDKVNTDNPCIADKEQNVWCIHPIRHSNDSHNETTDTELYEDNIGQIVVDRSGSIGVGTVSWSLKAGKLGLAALPALAGYANSSLGAAVAVGEYEAFGVFAPALLAVQRMYSSIKPESAALHVVRSIRAVRPSFRGAVMAMDKSGRFGASCHGIKYFPFSVVREDFGLRTYIIKCLTSDKNSKTQ